LKGTVKWKMHQSKPQYIFSYEVKTMTGNKQQYIAIVNIAEMI